MTQVRKGNASVTIGPFVLSDVFTGNHRLRQNHRRRRKAGFRYWLNPYSIGSGLIFILFSLFLLYPRRPGQSSIVSADFWRFSHRTNPEIEHLRQQFPVHVGEDEWEVIEHPGFQFSDQQKRDVIAEGISQISRNVKVPKFWQPSEYGTGGVRAFLGNHGKYLVTKDEANAIGSFNDSKETIFIAVTSYRDPECLETVEDIYRRAKYPERIRVAIVDQRIEGDPICSKPREPCDQNPQQSMCHFGHLIDATEYAAPMMVGPTFARHLAQRMYRGEYFAMQVDSHVRFVKNWDEDLIQQWRSIGNEMAVISTYLSDIRNSIDPITHESQRPSRAIMCKVEFEWEGSLTEHIKYGVQPTHLPQISNSPMLDPFWAAGFSFSRGHFVVQVPYDQYLPMVFQGEEISMTIRGYTYGYDYYSPVRSVAFHIYASRENRESRLNVRTFTENESLFPGAKDEAYYRLNGIIGLSKPGLSFKDFEVEKYGLGKVRKKEKFFHTFGINSESFHVEDGLCSFVQGTGSRDSMHKVFTPFLRFDSMGIDYSWVDFEYSAPTKQVQPIDQAEMEQLQKMLRKRESVRSPR